MGKTPGVLVVLGAICDDPICSFRAPARVNEDRDALIIAAALEGVPISQIAFATDMSRQRVYQIIDAWRRTGG